MMIKREKITTTKKNYDKFLFLVLWTKIIKCLQLSFIWFRTGIDINSLRFLQGWCIFLLSVTTLCFLLLLVYIYLDNSWKIRRTRELNNFILKVSVIKFSLFVIKVRLSGLVDETTFYNITRQHHSHIQLRIS